MSITVCFALLLLTNTRLIQVNSQEAIQQYVVSKDFFVGFKAPEFTVHDRNEKTLQYRIESNYGLLQNIKLLAYPAKKEVGRLQAKVKLLLYKAEISILNPQTNQWLNGIIEQNFQFLGSSFNINWNGYHLTMEGDALSLTRRFRDTNGQLLAQFRVRSITILTKRKYDISIFSNKYPEQIYLLALAAYDNISTSKNNG